MFASLTNRWNKTRRIGWVAWLGLLAACFPILLAQSVLADGENSASARAWIEQLGDSQYVVRSQAQIELRRMGVAAFDELDSATRHPDPETAATARYLLREIDVPWVHVGDSPAIGRIMQDYGSKSQIERIRALAQLAQLREAGRIAMLCRIARYDRSPLVSRLAAQAVMLPEKKGAAIPSDQADVIASEIEISQRPAAMWLRLYVQQLSKPEAVLAQWQQIIEQESELLQLGSNETTAGVVRGLLWNYFELNKKLGDAERARATADQMLALEPDRFDAVFVQLVDWYADQKAWDELDALVAKYLADAEKSKHTLYILANARAKQGKTELSEQLAEQAWAINPAGEEGMEGRLRVLEASELNNRSQYDWAKRELRHVIDGEKTLSVWGVYARMILSQIQFDLAEYREAAKTLADFEKTIQHDDKSRRLYNAILRDYRIRGDNNLYLPDLKTVMARRNYYLAFQYEQEGNLAKQREHLQAAIEYDAADADILIAMYRLKDSDDPWREGVRRRIERLSRGFQKAIDDDAEDPINYNQWAWLISNTEGDLDQALAYSKKSLELSPDDPGYLDTLGRCYFALGDYENAVKYQRRAVELDPHLQVMHRQLELFESTLAASQKKD